MSNQQIPQPNPSEASPAEIYSSTDSGPVAPALARIENKGPPRAEVTQHTLSHNRIDPYFYQQFIAIDTFTWSTTDVAGTLIWSMPIHPRRMGAALRHLCDIYNCWGGGFEIQVQIAGTGFNAGKLQIVRIPPNLDPKDYQAEYAWTHFANETFDPKALEAKTLTIEDQRPINYHYTTALPEEPQSWNIGGSIACYVRAGLNVSSTGSSQIQVIVSARCAPDFALVQIVPPTPLSPSKPVDYVETLNYIFAPPLNSSAIPRYLRTIKILPSSVKTAYAPALQMVDMEGFLDKSPYVKLGFNNFGDYLTAINGEISSTINNTITILPGDGKYSDTSNLKLLLAKNLFVTNLTSKNVTYGRVSGAHSIDVIDNKFILRWGTSLPDGWSTNDKLLITTEDDSFLDQKQFKISNWPASITQKVNESFVVFSDNLTGDGGTLQSKEMESAFLKGSFKNWMPSGQCALLSVHDTAEGVPLFFVKLWREGYLTAAASTDLKIFRLTTVYLRFSHFIARTAPIPLNAPSIGLNGAMRTIVASETKKALKAQRKSNDVPQE